LVTFTLLPAARPTVGVFVTLTLGVFATLTLPLTGTDGTVTWAMLTGAAPLAPQGCW
jgi:hypothetical protein